MIDNDGCKRDNGNPLVVFANIFIVCGLVISYIPQHYRIISTKSSDGISPWFLLLGCVSATCSLFNILILQLPVIECCSSLSGFDCFVNILGVIQLSLQWLMFSLIFILFMIYFPPHRKIVPYIRHLHFNSPPTNWSLEWRISVGVAITVTLHLVLTTIISLYLLSLKGSAAIYWADILGITSMLFASVQYLPQIWRTWRRKSVGALSIPMMLMQTPGAFVFALTLALRSGTRWTTWIVFLVTGCLQGILLIMCICWHYRSKRLGYGPFNVGETDSLVDRDGKPLVQEERARLLDENAVTPSNYGNVASNDFIVEES